MFDLVEFQDVSRLNENCQVISELGPSYLLKHAVDAERQLGLANEAAAYGLLQPTELSAFVPRLYQYDPDEHILTIELLPLAETVLERNLRLGTFPAGQATQLGTIIGTLHSLDPTPVREGLPMPHILTPESPHWVLALHRPHLEELHHASACNIELLKILQRFPEFGALLDRLHDDWHSTHLIHADIKWSNIIFCARPGSTRRSQIKVVDWELARIGDPCWDTGSAFADYLSFWLLSIPVTGEEPPDRYLSLARYPIEKMRPAVRAFWSAYTRRMQLDPTTADEWLIRSTRYAAARLIQTAYEQGQSASRLTGNTVCLLQLSFNILSRPEDAAVGLLGIPTRNYWPSWASTVAQST